MRIGAIAVVFSCVTLLVGPQEGQENQQVFRAGLKAVAVYVTVSDAQGRLVPDLTKEDFEVYDNGKKQEITLFDNGVQPITVVLMLDRSGSMVGNFSLVRSAAEQFVAQLLPADKARIGSFANRVQVDPREFTGSQHDLLEILRTELQEPGPTPLWNAVNVGITALLHQEGRRVVLVFTDGVDRPMGSNNISYHDVQRNAEQEDVMIFAVGLASRQFGGGGRGRGTGMGGIGSGSFRLPPEEPKVDAGLPKIATATGGGYFELNSANNLGSTFRRIADELHRQYALAFTPQNLDGKTHKLEVKLKQPDLVARARKTYVAKK
ncbi:MAG TPA: VWA domain-containing protein [Vicinamibacterales bacterium]|jgi:Ca-activated chloride channel homolog|nr:VWA domain-containing protein [Vicinamibacterales bacterium]